MAGRLRRKASEVPSSNDSDLDTTSLLPLRSSIAINKGSFEEFRIEDMTMLAPKSSAESDSNLSFPSQEPSLLEQLRTDLGRNIDVGKIFRSNRRQKDITVNFSLSSSSASLESSSTNSSLPLDRRHVNILSNKKKGHMTVDFTLNETASSVDNQENESPFLPGGTTRPVFKRPLPSRLSVRVDDWSESDVSKSSACDESLPRDVPRVRALKSALKTKADRGKNVSVDFSLGSSDSNMEQSKNQSRLNGGEPSSTDILGENGDCEPDLEAPASETFVISSNTQDCSQGPPFSDVASPTPSKRGPTSENSTPNPESEVSSTDSRSSDPDAVRVPDGVGLPNTPKELGTGTVLECSSVKPSDSAEVEHQTTNPIDSDTFTFEREDWEQRYSKFETRRKNKVSVDFTLSDASVVNEVNDSDESLPGVSDKIINPLMKRVLRSAKISIPYRHADGPVIEDELQKVSEDDVSKGSLLKNENIDDIASFRRTSVLQETSSNSVGSLAPNDAEPANSSQRSHISEALSLECPFNDVPRLSNDRSSDPVDSNSPKINKNCLEISKLSNVESPVVEGSETIITAASEQSSDELCLELSFNETLEQSSTNSSKTALENSGFSNVKSGQDTERKALTRSVNPSVSGMSADGLTEPHSLNDSSELVITNTKRNPLRRSRRGLKNLTVDVNFSVSDDSELTGLTEMPYQNPLKRKSRKNKMSIPFTPGNKSVNISSVVSDKEASGNENSDLNEKDKLTSDEQEKLTFEGKELSVRLQSQLEGRRNSLVARLPSQSSDTMLDYCEANVSNGSRHEILSDGCVPEIPVGENDDINSLSKVILEVVDNALTSGDSSALSVKNSEVNIDCAMSKDIEKGINPTNVPEEQNIEEDLCLNPLEQTTSKQKTKGHSVLEPCSKAVEVSSFGALSPSTPYTVPDPPQLNDERSIGKQSPEVLRVITVDNVGAIQLSAILPPEDSSVLSAPATASPAIDCSATKAIDGVLDSSNVLEEAVLGNVSQNSSGQNKLQPATRKSLLSKVRNNVEENISSLEAPSSSSPCNFQDQPQVDDDRNCGKLSSEKSYPAIADDNVGSVQPLTNVTSQDSSVHSTEGSKKVAPGIDGSLSKGIERVLDSSNVPEDALCRTTDPNSSYQTRSKRASRKGSLRKERSDVQDTKSSPVSQPSLNPDTCQGQDQPQITNREKQSSELQCLAVAVDNAVAIPPLTSEGGGHDEIELHPISKESSVRQKEDPHALTNRKSKSGCKSVAVEMGSSTPEDGNLNISLEKPDTTIKTKKNTVLETDPGCSLPPIAIEEQVQENVEAVDPLVAPSSQVEEPLLAVGNAILEQTPRDVKFPGISKRKSVSFKPASENLYHSPPDQFLFPDKDRTALDNRAQECNGYEFSQIQMTTDISDIQPSPNAKKTKKHFSSTPLPKSKKPIPRVDVICDKKRDDNLFVLPEPLALRPEPTDEFLIPPPVPPSKRVSILPVPQFISPPEPVGDVGLSPEDKAGSNSSRTESGKSSLDLSCENFLEISAIPKDAAGPKWANVFHSTPLHRAKTNKRKRKRDLPSEAPEVQVDPSPEEQVKIVNHSVQTSHNLRSISKTQESVDETSNDCPSKSVSPLPHDSTLRRSARLNKTELPPEAHTPKSSDRNDNNSSPADRISIQDDTILSTRVESQSRTRGSRSRSTLGSTMKSYDSHRKMTTRRLFKIDDENKSSTDAGYTESGTNASSPNSGGAPLSSQQDGNVSTTAEPLTAQADLPSLPETDGNANVSSTQPPEDDQFDSDTESVASSGTTASYDSIPSHVVSRQSFASQVSSLRSRSGHRRRRPDTAHKHAEAPKPKSKFALPRPVPDSELEMIYPPDAPQKKRRRTASLSAKLFNPGSKWKKSKQLYAWLKRKLGAKYGLETNLESERLVIELYRALILVSQGHRRHALDMCVERLKTLDICSNQLELYTFFMKFMPFDFVKEVVPMGGAFDKPFDPISPYDPV